MYTVTLEISGDNKADQIGKFSSKKEAVSEAYHARKGGSVSTYLTLKNMSASELDNCYISVYDEKNEVELSCKPLFKKTINKFYK